MVDRDPSADEADLDDLGPPVIELKELVEEPSPGFLQGIRNRIQRRAVMGQMLDLSVPMVGRVLMEYLSMVFALFGSGKSRVQREDDDNG